MPKKYLFSKAYAIGNTINAFKIAWFKVHCPKAFYKAYFKIKTDLNIKNYYCENQVQTELNKLYENKEINIMKILNIIQKMMIKLWI